MSDSTQGQALLEQQTNERAPDFAKVEHFVLEEVMRDASGAFAVALAAIGDRLGLFKVLSAAGPLSAAELAAKAQVAPRYASEWLAGMAAAGYVSHDPATHRFGLTPEQAFTLSTEGGPCSLGGGFQVVMGVLRNYDKVVEAFRTGRGVALREFHDDVWEGNERFSAAWHENFLVPTWIPAAGVKEKLERGAMVADFGCGGGRALIALARAFPRSTFVGFDVHEPVLERARASALAAGVADRVSFKAADVSKGVDGAFDLVTAFDVVHDVADPKGFLRAARAALRPGGAFLVLELNCSDSIEGNANNVGRMLYGFSIFECMTASLAEGGEGLGTVGLPPARLESFCKGAGFQHFSRVPVEDAFNALYLARP